MIKIEQELEFLENWPYHVIKCPDYFSKYFRSNQGSFEDYYAFNVKATMLMLKI